MGLKVPRLQCLMITNGKVVKLPGINPQHPYIACYWTQNVNGYKLQNHDKLYQPPLLSILFKKISSNQHQPTYQCFQVLFVFSTLPFKSHLKKKGHTPSLFTANKPDQPGRLAAFTPYSANCSICPTPSATPQASVLKKKASSQRPRS